MDLHGLARKLLKKVGGGGGGGVKFHNLVGLGFLRSFSKIEVSMTTLLCVILVVFSP